MIDARTVITDDTPVLVATGHHAFDKVGIALYVPPDSPTNKIGGAGLTSLEGFPLPEDQPFVVDLSVGDELWIVGTSTPTIVNLLETRY